MRHVLISILTLMHQVMERIDNALFSMEDPETMKSILMETGAYHRRIVGFNSEMFKVQFFFVVDF